ncbi:MAG: glutamate-5-semialdehyde dehydrogenase [Solirubrobacterales bacterium]
MTDHLQTMLNELGSKAKAASRFLSTAPTPLKNTALLAIADALTANTAAIVAANQIDLDLGAKMGLTSALLERLTLTDARVRDMAQGIREIAALPDPIGEMLGMTRRPNGLEVGRVRTPLGVIGIIYESRPNVTADAAALCLKSGNAVILRGGEEALNSNRVIARVIAEAAMANGIPEGAIQLIDSEDRQAVIMLMKLTEYVDVVIPRGGKGLKQAVVEHAAVPYIMTGMGNCHIYVDEAADLEKARRITFNAKVQRPSVCNAAEKLLVHEKAARAFLPGMIAELQKAGVEIRACERTRAIVDGLVPATAADWDEEYLSLIMGVKIVDSVEAAIEHINRHGTGHSEAIITENYTNARRFMAAIDAAAVYANASTRFTDGSVFGMGAEMGISTQKLHARGPMGVTELTTSKFIIFGDGQIR